jgi:hypothetical protein
VSRGISAIRRIHEELSQLSREILELREAYLAGRLSLEEYRKKRAELEALYERLAVEKLRKYTRSGK